MAPPEAGELVRNLSGEEGFPTSGNDRKK